MNQGTETFNLIKFSGNKLAIDNLKTKFTTGHHYWENAKNSDVFFSLNKLFPCPAEIKSNKKKAIEWCEKNWGTPFESRKAKNMGGGDRHYEASFYTMRTPPLEWIKKVTSDIHIETNLLIRAEIYYETESDSSWHIESETLQFVNGERVVLDTLNKENDFYQ